jgi:hypothetical protein
MAAVLLIAHLRVLPARTGLCCVTRSCTGTTRFGTEKDLVT